MGGRKGGCGDGRFVFRQMCGQLGIAEAPVGLAHDRRALAGRNRFPQRAEPQPCGREQTLVATVPPLAEQIEQLAILCTRGPLATGAVAQYCGKAVVEMHGARCTAPAESGMSAKCAIGGRSNSFRKVKNHSCVTRCKAGQLLS